MGIAAPRATWVTVRVNGEDYGTYLSVEGYDDVMLDRWFDTTTHLYEGAYGQDLTPDQVFWLESDEGDEWNRADLGR
jgi:spore coat protein CotH